MAFIYLSCSPQSDNTKGITSPISQDTIPTHQEAPVKDYLSDYQNRWEDFINVNPKLLPQGTIHPFTGKMAKQDIPLYKFILDTLALQSTDSTLGVFLNTIYGYTKTNFFIYNYVYPYEQQGQLKLQPFSKDTVIIPFRFDVDGELTLLTRWAIVNADTLAYVDYFKTPLGTKYASVEILKVSDQGQKRYIIGKTHFGEGGEYGTSIWFAEILADYHLSIRDLASCSGEDSNDTIVKLQHKEIKNGIKVYNTYYLRDNKADWSSKHFISEKYIGTYLYTD